MNTLRTLHLIGAIAKLVGGLAGAGIGAYEIKGIMEASASARLDVDDDIDTTIDCEAETTK